MQHLSLDIHKTKALLIGVSDYQFLTPIAPALGNIEDLKAILTDTNILGLPVENIIQVINHRNDEIFDTIVEFLENSDNINIETLLFYYVGHGIREKTSKELYLTGVNSKYPTIKTSAIPYFEIKRLIENSQLQSRIVILDACHSGLATQGINSDVFTEPELDIKGTYVLASSSDNEKSFFDSSGRHTFFTDEIVKLLRTGLPKQQPLISLDDIYIYMKKNLKLATPKRKTNLDTRDFYIFRNCQFGNIRILIDEADLVFQQGDYELARSKYLEAYRKNKEKNQVEEDLSEILNCKIDECEQAIRYEQHFMEKYHKKFKQKWLHQIKITIKLLKEIFIFKRLKRQKRSITILILIILVTILTFIAIFRGPSNEELNAKRIADSTKVADSLFKDYLEAKRIADSIRVADSLAMIQVEQQIIADSIANTKKHHKKLHHKPKVPTLN